MSSPDRPWRACAVHRQGAGVRATGSPRCGPDAGQYAGRRRRRHGPAAGGSSDVPDGARGRAGSDRIAPPVRRRSGLRSPGHQTHAADTGHRQHQDATGARARFNGGVMHRLRL
jgi:hypothetical protein